jgi:hypothetical protein
VSALLEPGSRAYMMSGCRIICSRQRAGWHLTISRPDRLPSWEDVRDARYALIPDEAVMVMMLPPRGEYVNVHEFCLQLYEIPRVNGTLCTCWRIRAIDPGVAAGPAWSPLDVQLVVDTVAESIVDAIETAAALHGIVLERVEEEAVEA